MGSFPSCLGNILKASFGEPILAVFLCLIWSSIIACVLICCVGIYLILFGQKDSSKKPKQKKIFDRLVILTLITTSLGVIFLHLQQIAVQGHFDLAIEPDAPNYLSCIGTVEQLMNYIRWIQIGNSTFGTLSAYYATLIVYLYRSELIFEGSAFQTNEKKHKGTLCCFIFVISTVNACAFTLVVLGFAVNPDFIFVVNAVWIFGFLAYIVCSLYVLYSLSTRFSQFLTLIREPVRENSPDIMRRTTQAAADRGYQIRKKFTVLASFSIISTLVNTLVFIVVTVIRGQVEVSQDVSILIRCVMYLSFDVDLLINSICLVLQYPFGDSLYFKAFCCGRLDKHWEPWTIFESHGAIRNCCGCKSSSSNDDDSIPAVMPNSASETIEPSVNIE